MLNEVRHLSATLVNQSTGIKKHSGLIPHVFALRPYPFIPVVQKEILRSLRSLRMTRKKYSGRCSLLNTKH